MDTILPQRPGKGSARGKAEDAGQPKAKHRTGQLEMKKSLWKEKENMTHARGYPCHKCFKKKSMVFPRGNTTSSPFNFLPGMWWYYLVAENWKVESTSFWIPVQPVITSVNLGNLVNFLNVLICKGAIITESTSEIAIWLNKLQHLE